MFGERLQKVAWSTIALSALSFGGCESFRGGAGDADPPAVEQPEEEDPTVKGSVAAPEQDETEEAEELSPAEAERELINQLWELGWSYSARHTESGEVLVSLEAMDEDSTLEELLEVIGETPVHELDLTGSWKYDCDDFEFLKEFSEVQTLLIRDYNFDYSWESEELAPITTVKGLEHLHINGAITEGIVLFLSSLESSTLQVALDGPLRDLSVLEKLSGAENITNLSLELSNTLSPTDYDDSERFAKTLQSLPALEELGLSYNAYQALHLKPLDALDSIDGLRVLHLNHCDLVERDRGQLANLDQIEKLTIGSYTELPGFSYFSEMDSLEEVQFGEATRQMLKALKVEFQGIDFTARREH